MARDTIPSPYVGLRPFREEDAPFFFGRSRETRVISSNLLQEPLTILYGPSGAGKSSVLQAGVIPSLRSTPTAAVVYFRNWQSDSCLHELTAACAAALAANVADLHSRVFLSLEQLVTQTQRRLFLLLDQFEEYLLYQHLAASRAEARSQPSPSTSPNLDGVLARLINRRDAPVNILIGLREDALSKLDQRFSIRIPDLLSNTLEVDRLDLSAAADAIRKPLEEFTKTAAANGKSFQIEDDLVTAIVDQVRTNRTAAPESGGIGRRSDHGSVHVETAYLELVLTKIWVREWVAGSSVLRASTLADMGGASQIVRNHVNQVLEKFATDAQRDIAARMFLHLVTPSRTKIAQSTEDLITYAEAPRDDVIAVLKELTDQPQTRILRRLPSPEQYEIFHDVLAEHILDWRRAYDAHKQREAEAAIKQKELDQAHALAEQQRLRAVEQAAAAARLRKTVMWLRLLAAFALLAAAVVSYQAYQVHAHKVREDQLTQKAIQDQASKQDAETKRLQAEIEAAQARGDATEAKRLKEEEQQSRLKTEEALRAAQSTATDAASTRKFLSDALDRANIAEKERDQLRAQLQTTESQLKAERAKPSVQSESQSKKGTDQSSGLPGPGGLSADVDGTGSRTPTSAKETAPASAEMIKAIAFGPDGATLIAVSPEKARVWNFTQPDASPEVVTLHQDATTPLAFGGQRVAAAIPQTFDKAQILIWDLRQPRSSPDTLGTFLSGSTPRLALSSDGHWLAVNGLGIQVWDLTKPTSIPVTLQDSEFDRHLALSPESPRLAATSLDDSVRVWNLDQPSAKPTVVVPKSRKSVDSLAISRDGKKFVVVTDDQKIRVWDVNQPQATPLPLLGLGKYQSIYSTAVSPDGLTIAATIYNGILIWDLRQPKLPPRLIKTNTSALAFSPDSQRLATGSSSGTVRTWDLATLSSVTWKP